MEDSTVLAVVGPWGSGKSSVINLACEELRKVDASWKVCPANVWAPPDAPALVAELFAAISTALPDDKRGKKVAKLIGEWAPLVVSGLSLIPGAGSTLGIVGNMAVGVANHAAGRHARRPMQQIFENLTESLEKLGIRVLVVLDDVDRLQPDELLTLFKAIRLVASFPGVYYLLAYDEQTVIDILTDTPIAGKDQGRAIAYLEKIVQVPLTLPPADRYYSEKMLTDGLTALLSRLDTPLTEEQSYRFRDMYDVLLQYSLSQPRAIGRFLRQAAAYLPMLDSSELDIVDFLALAHLRSYAPRTYRLLARSKTDLTPSKRDPLPPSSFHKELNDCIRDECGDLYAPTREAVNALFPALLAAREPGDPDIVDQWRDTEAEREATRRISVNEYFDRYFLLGLPIADISDSTVGEALRSIASDEPGDAWAKVHALITGPDPALASATYRKLIRFTKADGVIEPAKLAAVAYFAIGAVPDGSTHDPLTMDAESWAVAALAHIGEADAPMDTDPVAGLDDQALRRLCAAFEQVRVARRRHPSLRDARDHVAQEAGARLRAHLHQRDEADLQFPAFPFARFIAGSGTRDDFAAQIAADIGDGQFTIADLAARFVEVGIDQSGNAELLALADKPLVSIMGAVKLGELCAADADPTEPVSDFDEHDVTWPNRRTVGLAWLIKVLRDQKAVAPLPPSGVLRHDEIGPLHDSDPRSWLPRQALLSPSHEGASKSRLCVRAAILFPGSATGRPQRVSASVSADARAATLKTMLDQAQVTKWCYGAAETYGSIPASGWQETGDNTITTFSLVPTGPGDQPPLQAHCSLSIGTPPAGSADALLLALDLLLDFPFPPQAIPASPPYPLGEKLGIDHLARIMRMVADSAINTALGAGTEPLSVKLV